MSTLGNGVSFFNDLNNNLYNKVSMMPVTPADVQSSVLDPLNKLIEQAGKAVAFKPSEDNKSAVERLKRCSENIGETINPAAAQKVTAQTEQLTTTNSNSPQVR